MTLLSRGGMSSVPHAIHNFTCLQRLSGVWGAPVILPGAGIQVLGSNRSVIPE